MGAGPKQGGTTFITLSSLAVVTMLAVVLGDADQLSTRGSLPRPNPINEGERLQQTSDSTKGFVLPPVVEDGDTVAVLVLGETTSKQAVRMLPPAPGHGPSKPDRSRLRAELESVPANAGEVMKRVERAYNPWPLGGWLLLHFDRRDKLVIVYSNDYLGTLQEFAAKYPQLHEVARDDSVRHPLTARARLQADIHPCVLLEVFHRLNAQPSDSVAGVGYLFTCDTENRAR